MLHNKKHAKAVQIEDPEVVRRLLEKIAYDPATGCWVWQAYKDHKGYGQLRWGRRAHWAHRLSYAAFIGPIPQLLQIDHKCGNPSCINPAHLEAVTVEENRRRQTLREQQDHPAPF